LALLDQSQLRERVERLAAIERESASSGEARAAELIAAELRDAGARVTVEHEPAHGTYWWPVGLLCAAAGAAGLMRGRLAAVLVGAFATAGVTDDITGGSQWFRRRFLPQRVTTNVVAEMGDPGAARTVVVHAHHDAAHTGLVFDGGPPRALLRRFPALAEKANTTPPTMWGAVGGPLLVAVGALLGLRRVRRTGLFLCAGYTAAMADIGARDVVPGANDNLSGVAVLLSLAASLRDEPVAGLRVILLSAGSEESFMEGMQAYARRHFGDLPKESTTFLCLDTVGSPRLLALEGEGMVWMNDYPKDLLAQVHHAAAQEGVELMAGLRFRNATDGLIPLRAGYPTATLASCDEFKLPSNYHWPTDTADRLDYSTVAGCARVVRRLLTAIRTS
jgi:hypothetical protein